MIKALYAAASKYVEEINALPVKRQVSVSWILKKFVYLTSIMDLYSRKIIFWVLSATLKAANVVEHIEEAPKD